MLPPISGGYYLLEYLFEFGPTDGDKALNAPILESWERLLGIEWQPWQSRLLVQMSRAYMGEMHRATKRDAPPPWAEFAKPWRWVQQQKSERRLDGFLR